MRLSGRDPPTMCYSVLLDPTMGLMRRRDFITLSVGAAVSWPLVVLAQEAGRTYRVGFLTVSPRNAPYIVAMFDELRRLGLIEGQNLTADWRVYEQHIDVISETAVELVKSHVDVIYAVGDLGIRAAQRATATIPILGTTDDMVGAGLVNSLARPGGNTTGISILAPELNGKRQEILIEAVPLLRHIAALADSNVTSSRKLQDLQDAARARNIELSIHSIAAPEEIPAAVDAAKASGAGALNVLASPLLTVNRQIIAQRVAALRLPAIYQWPETVEEGGFVAYGPRLVQVYRELVVPQLVKLLRGAKPSDIPVMQPTRFELVINLKTAKALGLTMPESFLVRADQVIE
jgi:putative tryptophan/tyrosine transport system substrate-binding protein